MGVSSYRLVTVADDLTNTEFVLLDAAYPPLCCAAEIFSSRLVPWMRLQDYRHKRLVTFAGITAALEFI